MESEGDDSIRERKGREKDFEENRYYLLMRLKVMEAGMRRYLSGQRLLCFS